MKTYLRLSLFILSVLTAISLAGIRLYAKDDEVELLFTTHAAKFKYYPNTMKLKAKYDFKTAEQTLDWAGPGVRYTGGALFCLGLLYYGVHVKGQWVRVEFDKKDIEVTFEIKTGSCVGLGACVLANSEGTQYYLACAHIRTGDDKDGPVYENILCEYDHDKAVKEGIWSCVLSHGETPRIDPTKWNKMVLKVRSGSLTFKIGRAYFKGNKKVKVKYDTGGVMVGFLDGQGEIRSIEVEGRLSKEWHRKMVRTIETMEKTDERRKTGGSVKLVDRERPLSAIELAAAVPGAKKAEEILKRLLAARTFDQVEKLLDEAQKAAPEYPVTCYYRAVLLGISKAYRKAIKELEKALKLCPGFYECHGLIGRFRQILRLKRGAEEAYSKQIETAPADDPAPLLDRADYYIALRDFDKAKKDIEAARIIAPDSRRLAYTGKTLKFLKDGPDWDKHAKGKQMHYLVHTNISRDHARMVSRKLETLSKKFREKLPGLGRSAGTVDVYLFDTLAGFYDFSGQIGEPLTSGTLGYFNPFYDFIVMYDDLTNEVTLCVAYHEAFHEWIHSKVPSPPIWFNEGCAEYFGSFKFNPAADKMELGSWTYHSRLSQAGLGLRSLRDFMLLPHAAYSGSCYAQGWAMVTFFMESGQYEKEFAAYVSAVKRGRNEEECLKAGFGSFSDEDWSEMAMAMRRYISSLR